MLLIPFFILISFFHVKKNLGIVKGDRIAVCLPNNYQYVLLQVFEFFFFQF